MLLKQKDSRRKNVSDHKDRVLKIWGNIWDFG
jgi:hypothetical protein